MLTALNFTMKDQADGDGVLGFQLPRNAQLVGVDKSVRGKSGTLTNHTIDINKGNAAALAAVCAGGNNGSYGWRSTHFGGAAAPVAIEGDEAYTVDVNISGGGHSELTVTLWLLMSEI